MLTATIPPNICEKEVVGVDEIIPGNMKSSRHIADGMKPARKLATSVVHQRMPRRVQPKAKAGIPNEKTQKAENGSANIMQIETQTTSAPSEFARFSSPGLESKNISKPSKKPGRKNTKTGVRVVAARVTKIFRIIFIVIWGQDFLLL